MVRTRECDYCGGDIEPGTGTMLVRVDGTTIHYCSAKCEKNADLGREARDLEWTDTARPEAGQAATESGDAETEAPDVATDDVEEAEEVDDAVEATDEAVEEAEEDEEETEAEA